MRKCEKEKNFRYSDLTAPPYYFGPHLPVSGIGRAKVKAEDAVKANASPTAAKLGPRPCVPAKNPRRAELAEKAEETNACLYFS